MADITPLIQTLLGGVLSLLGGFLSPTYIDHIRSKREARNLALAFSGEILALKRIVETRRYIEDLRTCVNNIRQTGEPIYFSVSIRKEYFQVYKENVSRIGLLKPPLPESIAMFYTQAQSILEDMEDFNNWTKMEQLGQENLLRRYEEVLILLESTNVLSSQIIDEISRIYRS